MLRRCWFRGLLSLAILCAVACERPPSSGSTTKPADTPNVLLITLDTVRADRLGCYGYAKAQTPVLDALAASGVRFEQVSSQVPLTLPSHASLLTSTYPLSNGLRFNAAGVLNATVPTLAEFFQAYGYRTGAFVAATVLDSAFGLNRGFERYDDKFGESAESTWVRPERPANEVCDAALAWLGQPSSKPFFAWVHFFDPHAPYEPPVAFREKLADPYDGEIAFVDSQIRRLVDWLDAGKLRDRTLIVVAGDHGEAFGEHGEVCHGLLLYDTTLRVPLILSCPARLPAGKVVRAGVRLIDVMPTVLDLMKWEPASAPQGESVLPLLTAESLESLPAYSETDYPRASFGWAPLRAYATQQWKYIEAPRPELYDRVADPGEMTNLVAARPEIVARLQRELADLSATMVRRDAQSVSLDDQATRSLVSLGYVGGTGSSTETDAGKPRRDPKDMVETYRRMTTVHNYFVLGRWPEVVQILEPLLVETPESDELHAMLGEAYLQLHRYPDAERAYVASLRTVPNSAQKWCKLGDALYFQSKLAEALKCYEQAVSISPGYGMAHNRLGVLYLRQKQFDKAQEHLRRCVELNPSSVNAKAFLADALAQMGRHQEAIAMLQEALRADPKFAPAYQTMAQILVATRRGGEAVATLRAGCAAVPDDLSLKNSLARFLLSTSSAGPAVIQEALGLAKQCCDADPNSPEHLEVWAMALAASGEVNNAATVAARAFSLAQSQGKADLAARIQARLQTYRPGPAGQ